MSLTFQLEPWATYYRDCQDLWAEEHTEINPGGMELKPDVPTYAALDRAGQLQILTARDGGRMVGYVLSLIRTHLHSTDVLCGYEDTFFLSKSYRRGWAGISLIREAIEHMRCAGVQRVFFTSPVSFDTSAIFMRLGFSESHVTFSKWIG